MKKSSLTNEIVERKNFSGWLKDKSVERQKSYDEYKNLISESRYVLCPRGDGNQSLRFYEALSAGRVPVLIDSQIKLPLRELIDYSKITITLKLKDSVKTWDRIINDFEDTHSENFNDFSKKISEIYDSYLSHEVFIKLTFDNFIIKP